MYICVFVCVSMCVCVCVSVVCSKCVLNPLAANDILVSIICCTHKRQRTHLSVITEHMKFETLPKVLTCLPTSSHHECSEPVGDELSTLGQRGKREML